MKENPKKNKKKTKPYLSESAPLDQIYPTAISTWCYPGVPPGSVPVHVIDVLHSTTTFIGISTSRWHCRWCHILFTVPYFLWDRLDIPRLTVTAILIFKCTEGAGVGDYGSAWGEGEKNRGTVMTSLQLAFTKRVVPATQAFDWSLDNRC